MTGQEKRWLLEEKYKGSKCEAFAADCQRLANGEPLAYLIGYAPFLNCQIYLDSHPLIPRPETEFWVEKAIGAINRTNRDNLKILDLCAGSGAIGVAVAKAVPSAQVDFAEIDSYHLPTIEKNITRNLISSRLDLELSDQYRVVESDLFSSRSNLELEKYDFILSNPPYIDPALDRTETSVKEHEPHKALYGGQDGMELIASIIKDAPAFLKPAGQLWLEHEPEQTEPIHALAAKHGFFCTTHKDQYDLERYSVLTLK